MSIDTGGVAVIESHPVQYHAPVYRALQQQFGVPVTAIYGSDFSIVGYRDTEFGADFAWDSDLLSGYSSIFVERQAEGGAKRAEDASAKGIRRILRQVKPQAILLVGYGSRFSRAAIVQALSTGCPLLLRAESTDHARSRSWLSSLIRDRILKTLYARISGLLYVGQRSRQHFLRLGCAESKLTFSPYCVDVAPFQPSEHDRELLRDLTRQSLGILPHQKALLFSGKLSKRKGVDLFLEAVRKLPAGVLADAVVVFLGNGELRQELEESAKREPQVEVRFLGFQNQSSLSAYYHASDLLVLPSIHSETWGLVINEAMHHGLATVVTQAVGCGPDLVEPGRTGEICGTGSRDELALAISNALAWCTTKDVRERCRSRVTGYSVDEAARGIFQAFGSILPASRSLSVARTT
jgi:glycosyltransferase involved in cell wall biosynthesis